MCSSVEAMCDAFPAGFRGFCARASISGNTDPGCTYPVFVEQALAMNSPQLHKTSGGNVCDALSVPVA